MKWNNLRVGRCPKCECKLDKYKNNKVYYCGANACTFKITEEKLLKLTSELHEQHVKNFIPRAGFRDFFDGETKLKKQQRSQKEKRRKNTFKRSFSEAARKEYGQNMDFIKSI